MSVSSDLWSDPPDEPPEIPMDIQSSGESRKRPRDNKVEDSSIPKKTIINPASSTQHVYTVPQFQQPKDLRFDETDLGPFVVHVTRLVSDPTSGSSMRLLKLAQMLFKNKVSGINSEGIKSIGRNKASIEFKTAKDGNDFLDGSFLSINKFEAKIPVFQVTRMGIIKGIPTEWSMEELVDALNCPPGCGPVLKARRLNRKTYVDNKPIWVPSQTVSITLKGKLIPKKIYCFNAAIAVESYQLPSIQCLACCRFGHIQTACRSKLRCFKCSQPHSGSSCPIIEAEATCVFCSGRHFAIDKRCPEHGRQKLIKTLVSDENISYNEAAARVPTVNRRLYADIVSSNPAPSSYNNTPSTSQKAQNISYKKTVVTPRRPTPALGKSYDKMSHDEIIVTPSSSFGNGCCLKSDNCPPSQSENLLELLSYTLLNMISKFDDALPYNILQILQKISSVTNSQHGSVPSMECQECPTPKA